MSATHESTQDLLVSVHNTIYPINEQVLHQVFVLYGYVEKIDILQSSELLQAIVRFDLCQNAVWAKKQLQGRYIYDRCCQLDIQFYNKIDYEDKTENLLLENAFALDLDFIRNTLQEMMVIIERMQDRMKARNSSSLFTIAAAPTPLTTAATKSTAPAPPLPQTLGPAAPFLHLLSLPTMAPSSLVKPYNSTHQILKSFSDSHIEFLFGIPDTLYIMSQKRQLKIALNSFDKSKLVRAQIAIGCGAVFEQKYRKDETSPYIKMLGESEIFVFDPGGIFNGKCFFHMRSMYCDAYLIGSYLTTLRTRSIFERVVMMQHTLHLMLQRLACVLTFATCCWTCLNKTMQLSTTTFLDNDNLLANLFIWRIFSGIIGWLGFVTNCIGCVCATCQILLQK